LILLIDNYDSFTWNLVHLVAAARRDGAVGATVLSALRPGRASGPDTALASKPARTVAPGINVARNDEITVEDARAMRPTHVIISPGPCGPAEAGVSVDIVREFAGRVPVLGVCLGHQSIAAAFGMRVRRLENPVHGLASPVHHDGRGLFEGLPNPLAAARYHSLVVPEEQLKHGGNGEKNGEGWEVSAWGETEHGKIVMGMRRVWMHPSPVLPRPDGGRGRVFEAGGGVYPQNPLRLEGCAVNPPPPSGRGRRKAATTSVSARAPLEGVQFHPESFLTEHGVAMMRRFLGDTVAP
jgi:anthranilate synthase component 2